MSVQHDDIESRYQYIIALLHDVKGLVLNAEINIADSYWIPASRALNYRYLARLSVDLYTAGDVCIHTKEPFRKTFLIFTAHLTITND